MRLSHRAPAGSRPRILDSGDGLTPRGPGLGRSGTRDTVVYRDSMINAKPPGTRGSVSWHQDFPFYPHTNVHTFGAKSLIIRSVLLSKSSFGMQLDRLRFPGCNCSQEDPPCPSSPFRTPASRRFAPDHRPISSLRSETRGIPSRFARRCHAVADAALVEEVGGVGRVVAELRAELAHERAHALSAGGLAPFPHLA